MFIASARRHTVIITIASSRVDSFALPSVFRVAELALLIVYDIPHSLLTVSLHGQLSFVSWLRGDVASTKPTPPTIRRRRSSKQYQRSYNLSANPSIEPEDERKEPGKVQQLPRKPSGHCPGGFGGPVS